MKKIVQIGGVYIGGSYRVAIQSMSDLPTRDIDAVVKQAEALKKDGCDIFRVAVPDTESARALAEIKKRIEMPLVADIHFDYKLAIQAAAFGADKIRINPGNMPVGGLKELTRVLKAAHIPLRVGINGGSLEKKYSAMPDRAMALAMSAADCVKRLEDDGFFDIVISLKSSSVLETVKAYRYIDKLCDYPLHIGVTEAGIGQAGVIKSAAGLGALLLDGIGNTVRVSLTGDPSEEIRTAKGILRAVGLDRDFAEIISCPKCGRCAYDTESLAKKVAEFTRHVAKPLKIAVMGCVVNGPGEAETCDIGIAFGSGKAVIFKCGKVFLTVRDKDAEEIFLKEIDKIIAES
ncbi:MAG: flavodoxin-dependent (E)-4-hydroxy-3-methylbut-2-enyl-diphosphate synthase [Clostridiales bacterium]|jgi:(E)-4-hydroxy-3-methylbut-2-enyl-diphosphate synthase|nr:flavodoxin-dependent (E)-4-hydroxy-3-methylbut-2-enyl-diphosphate synthase [Clostridiales bacterium]